ncbi:MAG: 50S ribosomal protein L22 [Nanoarchaeota archaeon]|nr:50S ribosomal protein L22 [Nanoarchaeota archaeon]
MGKEKLEARQEKTKEKLEEKARKKKEEKEAQAAGEKPKTEKKEKKKVEVKKPKVEEAKGKGVYLPISPKISVEVCRAIKGKEVEKAKRLLKDVIAKKRPIRYYRYNRDTPHKPGKGFGAGRYPVKVSKYILEVLENAIANATYLNLDPEKLYVKIARSERAISKERRGRYANIEIIVAEKKEKEAKKKKVKK